MVRQWARCLVSNRSVSLRETRLILEFQSRSSLQNSCRLVQLSSSRSETIRKVTHVSRDSVISLINLNLFQALDQVIHGLCLSEERFKLVEGKGLGPSHFARDGSGWDSRKSPPILTHSGQHQLECRLTASSCGIASSGHLQGMRYVEDHGATGSFS